MMQPPQMGGGVPGPMPGQGPMGPAGKPSCPCSTLALVYLCASITVYLCSLPLQVVCSLRQGSLQEALCPWIGDQVLILGITSALLIQDIISHCEKIITSLHDFFVPPEHHYQTCPQESSIGQAFMQIFHFHSHLFKVKCVISTLLVSPNGVAKTVLSKIQFSIGQSPVPNSQHLVESVLSLKYFNCTKVLKIGKLHTSPL